MGKRWFWQDGSDDLEVGYQLSYIQDDDERAVPVAMVYTREDAEKILSALRWYETFEAGHFAMPPLPRAAKKAVKKPAKRTPTKARK